MFRWKRWGRWMLIAVLAAPMFASSSCVKELNGFLDDQSNRNDDLGDDIDNLLDDIGDFFDDAF